MSILSENKRTTRKLAFIFVEKYGHIFRHNLIFFKFLKVVSILEKHFQKDNYIQDKKLEELIELTDLNEKQIKSWFKQRRHRLKVENKPSSRVSNSRKRASSKTLDELEDSSNQEDELDYCIDDDKSTLSSDLNSDLNEASFLNSKNQTKSSNKDDFLSSFSKTVNEELEKAFKKSKYLNANDKKAMCTKLNIKTIDLERWFYFKRKNSKTN